MTTTGDQGMKVPHNVDGALLSDSSHDDYWHDKGSACICTNASADINCPFHNPSLAGPSSPPSNELDELLKSSGCPFLVRKDLTQALNTYINKYYIRKEHDA